MYIFRAPLLFIVLVVLYAFKAEASCVFPQQEVIIKDCKRTDAERATLTLADGKRVEYRAYYIDNQGGKWEKEDLDQSNPCDTLTLNKLVSLQSVGYCDDTPEPMEEKRFKPKKILQNDYSYLWLEPLHGREKLHPPPSQPVLPEKPESK